MGQVEMGHGEVSEQSAPKASSAGRGVCRRSLAGGLERGPLGGGFALRFGGGRPWGTVLRSPGGPWRRPPVGGRLERAALRPPLASVAQSLRSRATRRDCLPHCGGGD